MRQGFWEKERLAMMRDNNIQAIKESQLLQKSGLKTCLRIMKH